MDSIKELFESNLSTHRTNSIGVYIDKKKQILGDSSLRYHITACCSGFPNYAAVNKYVYIRLIDMAAGITPGYSAEEYCDDLHKNFALINGNPPVLYKDKALYIEVDFESISGMVMLGIINFYRAIEEGADVPIVYQFLKEHAPELNFYQRLIAANIVNRPNVETTKSLHTAFNPILLLHMKNLSLENLISWWAKERPQLIPYSGHKVFGYRHHHDLTNIRAYSTNSSQYSWLPTPWASDTYLSKVPLTGLNWSNKTIKYLLDDNPKKEWLSYA